MLKYLLLSLLSGFLSFSFITIVNKLVSQMMAGESTGGDTRYVLAFALIVIAFIACRRLFAVSLINFSQKMFWRLRSAIIELVLRSSYEQFKPREAEVYSALVHDVGLLTQATLMIINFSTSVIIIIACFVYMVNISMLLFFATLVVVILGVTVYQWNAQRVQQELNTGRTLQDEFMVNFTAILSGFREVQLDPRKGMEIYSGNIKRVATESIASNRRALVGLVNNQVTGQVLFYCLIGLVLLYLRDLYGIEAKVVVNFIFLLLFLLGAVESTMVMLPTLMQSWVSVVRLSKLKNELENFELMDESVLESMGKADFEEIILSDLRYNYRNFRKAGSEPETFEMGPVNLQINKHEVIFIYGSNGSGKTTLVLTMLGLLRSGEGCTLFNGVPLNDSNYRLYRTLFGVVFSDFYLFEKLYGVTGVDAEKAKYYLKLFELDDKVQFEGRAFSSRDLSTGQRKRLALISVLLENKPILVLDEWAADQDPYFRRKFYTEIIPLLKQEGFTIVAITHDDKYYNCADKLYRMDFGRLTEISIQETTHPLTGVQV